MSFDFCRERLTQKLKSYSDVTTALLLSFVDVLRPLLFQKYKDPKIKNR